VREFSPSIDAKIELKDWAATAEFAMVWEFVRFEGVRLNTFERSAIAGFLRALLAGIPFANGTSLWVTPRRRSLFKLDFFSGPTPPIRPMFVRLPMVSDAASAGTSPKA
jgi:hypothetical protein